MGLALLLGAAPGCECRSEPHLPKVAKGATVGALAAKDVNVDPPADEGAIGPKLSRHEDGRILLSYVQGPTVRVVAWTNEGWEAPQTAVTSDALFANWADVPSITMRGSERLLHFPEKSGPGKYAYDFELAHSAAGADFVRMGAAHDDGTETEHGFVSLLAEQGGFRAFWLDGRQMVRDAPMTLRTARIEEGRVLAGEVLDARVCECCRTAAAVTSEGPFVVYRDRGEAEVRNIGIVRREGAGWSKPVPIHDDGWQVSGCPVNGPAADARGREGAVAWYTGVDGGHVRVALSKDAARTFDVFEVDVDVERVALGRVAVALIEGSTVVAWLASDTDGDALILMRRVHPDGRLGAVQTVAKTSAARTSGFPQMVRAQDALLFVWTEAGPPTRLRGRRMPTPPAAGALAPATRAASPARPRSLLPRPAPSFAATTIEGRPVTLASLRGRPVLLNLWATWCGPCRDEMGALQTIADRAPELAVIGVSVDGLRGDDRVREVIAARKVRYPIWRDPTNRVSLLFGARAVPATYLIDAQGRVVFERLGIITPADAGLWAAVGAL